MYQTSSTVRCAMASETPPGGSEPWTMLPRLVLTRRRISEVSGASTS
jgi:hypothetical protein